MSYGEIMSTDEPEPWPSAEDEPWSDDICYECDGEGWIVADCFEDTCCCADPEVEHGLIRCPNCRGNA